LVLKALSLPQNVNGCNIGERGKKTRPPFEGIFADFILNRALKPWNSRASKFSAQLSNTFIRLASETK
jgi:hypothetical protein